MGKVRKFIAKIIFGKEVGEYKDFVEKYHLEVIGGINR